MIRIPINEKQKNKIEKIYCQWFEKNQKALKEVIEKDNNFKYIIFRNDEYNEKKLLDFLLSDVKALKHIKLTRDRETNKQITSATKKYLKRKYKNFRSLQAIKIVKELNISVCPYCNQNYITVYSKKGKYKFNGDLDHYYSQDKYPELSICLYNLIPSCKVCNHLKLAKESKIINPYDITNKSNIRFRTTFSKKVDLNYIFGRSNNFKIIIEKDNLKEEEINEIDLFNLEERYKKLKMNVKEIILKSQAYDPTYNKKISSMLGNISDKEINQFIYGYTDNHLERNLSKFNQDMMNEFKNNE